MPFHAKTIGLIIYTSFILGIFSQASCMKYSNTLSMAIPGTDTSRTSNALPDTINRSYLALGDSYTIGESVAVADRYPVQAVQLLRTAGHTCQDPEIIATTGWTTGDLLSALQGKTAAHPYSIVTLLIGVNNQYQGKSQSEYRDQFTALLRQSIALAGDSAAHVIVLSIPDYSVTPFAHGQNIAHIAAQIDSFNKINYQVSLLYQVHYLDITGESRKAATDPSLIATDGLHFSGKEYGIWAALMAPAMRVILNFK